MLDSLFLANQFTEEKKNPKQLNVFGKGHIVLDKIIVVEENEEKQLLSTK